MTTSIPENPTHQQSAEHELSKRRTKEMGRFYADLVTLLSRLKTEPSVDVEGQLARLLDTKHSHLAVQLDFIVQGVKKGLAENHQHFADQKLDGKKLLFDNILRGYKKDATAEQRLQSLQLLPRISEAFPGMIYVLLSPEDMEKLVGAGFITKGTEGILCTYHPEKDDFDEPNQDVRFVLTTEGEKSYVDAHEVHHLVMMMMEQEGLVADPFKGFKERGSTLMQTIDFHDFRNELVAYTISFLKGYKKFADIQPRAFFSERYVPEESLAAADECKKFVLFSWDIYQKLDKSPSVSDYIPAFLGSISFEDIKTRVVDLVVGREMTQHEVNAFLEALILGKDVESAKAFVIALKEPLKADQVRKYLLENLEALPPESVRTLKQTLIDTFGNDFVTATFKD